jgi:hypothetical protein
MKNSEKEIVAQINKKLLGHGAYDAPSGRGADKHYGLNTFREDISKLSLDGLETLKFKARPSTFEYMQDYLEILNNKIDACRSRKVRNKTYFALLLSIISIVIALFALFSKSQ